MCQAIAEGGRRCAVHRRDTIAVIHAVTSATSLPQDITEELFVELRREARHMDTNQGLEDSYTELIASTEQTLSGIRTGERYLGILAERTADDTPAPDTTYALTRLQTAAMERSQALHQELQVIAENQGIRLVQARELWDNARRDVKNGLIEVSDADWNDAAQDDAFNRNLPYDKASVVAFARLRENATQARGERRVTPVDFTHRSTSIHSAGYNPEGGRLEVTFQSNPERVYAYHSVPESAWENMCDENSSPGRVVRQFLRNSDHQYATQEEADNDAYTVRCSSCGQFASASAHTCPERVVEESGVAVTPEVAAVAAERIAEAAEDIREGEVSVNAIVENAVSESEDTIEVEDVPEDPSVNPVTEDETTGETTLDLPYDRSEMLPSGLSDVDRESAFAYDRQVDGAVARINELQALEDGREAIEGGPSQDGSIQHRLAENIIDFSRDRSLDEAVLSRYRVQRATGFDARGVSDSPERTDEERQNSYDIVLDNFESIERAGGLYDMPAGNSRHFVASMDADQFTPTGHSRFRRGIRHTPVARGPFNVSVEEREYAGGRNGTYVVRSVTDEERARVEAEYRATADGQLERTEFDRIQTAARTYAPRMMETDNSDVNLLENHRVAWAGVRNVRRVLAEDGGTVSAPIHYEIARPRLIVRDEHGNVLRPSDGSANVTGTLAVTREGDNYRTTSGRHELRCDCPVYRRNYHCRHIDFVRDNGYRIARNMATPAASGASSGPFQAQLMSRADFSHFTEEDGTLVGRFTEGEATRRSRPPMSGRHLIQAGDVDVENPSVEDTNLVRSAYGTRFSVPRANIVNTALVRAGRVEIELGSYANYVGNVLSARTTRHRISGTLDLTRNNEGEIVVSTARARCSCGRFASAEDMGSGTCPHIQHFETLMTRHYNGVDDTFHTTDDFANVGDHAENIVTLRILERVEVLRSTSPHASDEDLYEEAESYIAAEQQRMEEEAERERQARAHREAQAAERRRLASLSFAERAVESEDEVRREREAYLAREPEFAEGLAQYKAHRKEQWNEVEPGYGGNVESLRSDFNASRSARESRNETHLEPMVSGVTDGICDPSVPGHRKFGIEIEFDLPPMRDSEKQRILENITTDAREAGLTSQAHFTHGYRANARAGWPEWSVEYDSSVAGEIVSPLLSDDEESWSQVGKILEIVKRHGGRASVKTGAHVHVSTGSYLQSLAKHAELSATVKEHQDVLYRAAADPSRRQHRGTRYCAPNVQPPQVDIGKDQRGTYYNDPSILSLQRDRFTAVNFEGTQGLSKKEHVEFRMWDGSLDLATIQQQVAISAAITDYAERRVDTTGQYMGSSRPSSEDVLPQSGSTEVTDGALLNVGNLVDKVFRRQEDRKRFMAMFAANKWA